MVNGHGLKNLVLGASSDLILREVNGTRPVPRGPSPVDDLDELIETLLAEVRVDAQAKSVVELPLADKPDSDSSSPGRYAAC